MRLWTTTSALARTTVSEAIRDRILYGLLVFAVGLILLSAVLSNLTLGYQVRIVTNVSLSAITLAGTLMSVLLGVGSVSREIERRTSYPILAKPITRAEYLAGKYFGVLATVYLNVLLMMAAATLMIQQYTDNAFFQYPLLPYLFTLGLTLLRLAVVAAIALTLSTFTSSTVALIGTVGLTLAGYFTAELRFFLTKSESEATQWLGNALYYAVPDFSALDTLPLLLHGHAVTAPTAIAATGYAVCYIVFLLTAASLIFSRRDLP